MFVCITLYILHHYLSFYTIISLFLKSSLCITILADIEYLAELKQLM